MTPDKGTSHSNEVILAVAGDASAAKTAVLNARQIGLELLIAMGSYPEIPGSVFEINFVVTVHTPLSAGVWHEYANPASSQNSIAAGNRNEFWLRYCERSEQ